MRILFLSNNLEVTNSVYQWLQRNEGAKRVALCSEKLTLRLFDEKFPSTNFIVSYNYDYVIKKDILDSFPGGAINLHISFLPWNRGIAPNLWSFVEDTAKGVTIHKIDAGLDTGDVLLQKECCFDEKDETFVSTYNKLHCGMRELFFDNWKALKHDCLPAAKQPMGGSYHGLKDTRDFISRHGIIWSENIGECKRRIESLGYYGKYG
jgi:methionyl-tRNA formyltransferase